MTIQSDAAERAQSRALTIAALLMVLAAVLNALDSIIVRHVSADGVHPFVIGFFRAVFGLIAVTPWILARRHHIKTKRLPLHALRAGLKLLSLVAFFVALAQAPLADVTAIIFASPIFVTVGAWIFLGEKPELRRILSVALGFAGVLIILAPGSAGIPTALWFALAGTLIQAVSQLFLKAMSGREPADTLVAWNLILTVPLAALPAWWFWTPPSWETVGFLAAQGVMGAVNMTAITYAMSLAPATHVAPFEFLRLPAVAILSFALFGEVAGISTWVGATIIFGTTLIVAGPRRIVRTTEMTP